MEYLEHSTGSQKRFGERGGSLELSGHRPSMSHLRYQPLLKRIKKSEVVEALAMRDDMRVTTKKPKRTIGKILKSVGKVIAGNKGKARSKVLSLADFQVDQAQFEAWRAKNPTSPFKDFYAERKLLQISKGESQSSFGANLRSGPFEKSGIAFFELLVGCGLKQTDTCVDYGCGTLRIGLHAIKYLGRGKYWGLDIADWLLKEGHDLIGPKLVAEKQPQLRVISHESIKEAAASKPDFVFSAKVMQHVHPAELSEYFGNIITMIGRTGQAIVDSKWRQDRTVQYRINSWAHAMPAMQDIVAELGGRIEIVSQSDRMLPLEGAGYAKMGIFRVVHKSAPSAAGQSY